MKRSEHLQPLSHDHYEGLIVQSRIRTGLDKGAPAELIAEYVAAFWDAHLSQHFQHEEEHLLPLRADLEDDELFDQMLGEHRDIREQIERVRDAAGTEELLRLAEMMKAHIRFEERKLFPKLEKHVPEEKLRRVGDKLVDVHVDANLRWEPAFWE